MGFYKTSDINKVVTLFVKQYLDNGYWFHMREMNTSYSEAEGTIQLTNGIEDVRVQLKHTYGKRVWTNNDNKYCTVDYFYIEIRMAEHSDNYWEYRGKEIETYTYREFYKIKNGTYTDSLEQYLEIEAKRYIRRNTKAKPYNDHGRTYLKNYDLDKVYQIVKHRKGFSSCRKSQIKNVIRFYNADKPCCYCIDVEGKKSYCKVYCKKDWS